MEKLNEYNEQNISKLLDHIRELRAEDRLAIAPMLEQIKTKIAEYNKNRPSGTDAARAYSRSTLYKKMDDRKRLLNAIGKEAFHATIDFLSERGLLESNISNHSLYHAVSDFLSISSENEKEAENRVPGVFRTYRPSLSTPGYAIVGLLYVYKNNQGYLKTKEVIHYRVNKTEPWRRQFFKGNLWRTCGHYLCLTTDTNTQFMQTLILRSAYVDGDKIRTMEGSYSGITMQQGTNIFTTKIYLQRVDIEPFGEGWFKTLLTLGLKVRNDKTKRNQIPESIWEIINPENDKNIVFF